MDEDLNPEQLASQEAALIKLEVDLQDLLTATEAGAQPVKLKDNQGRLTRMDEMHNQSILVANRNVTTNRLRAVRAALGRLRDGVYGYCTVCEEPVALPRLEAYPEAAMCLECQSAREG